MLGINITMPIIKVPSVKPYEYMPFYNNNQATEIISYEFPSEYDSDKSNIHSISFSSYSYCDREKINKYIYRHKLEGNPATVFRRISNDTIFAFLRDLFEIKPGTVCLGYQILLSHDYGGYDSYIYKLYTINKSKILQEKLENGQIIHNIVELLSQKFDITILKSNRFNIREFFMSLDMKKFIQDEDKDKDKYNKILDNLTKTFPNGSLANNFAQIQLKRDLTELKFIEQLTDFLLNAENLVIDKLNLELLVIKLAISLIENALRKISINKRYIGIVLNKFNITPPTDEVAIDELVSQQINKLKSTKVLSYYVYI
jgi:hypothetical protein